VIRFYTDHLHPLYSKDYTEPKGGAHDNTGSDFFVDCFNNKTINYLDLGCAGAALVESMFNKGHNSFGIDGSDSQKKQGLNSWGRIPERLFNADITEPFHFVDEDTNEKFKFNVISAWDVMEHLYEDKLPGFCDNLKNNLKSDGYFVCGIADFEDEGYHVTIHNKEWWIDMFDKNGLVLITDTFDEVARNSSFNLKLRLK
jgi:cyclopropane fatty-acyl-phospholipid synthase-like methyltransferase